jgi:uncharacterized protein YajQ (UPF0234 family)
MLLSEVRVPSFDVVSKLDWAEVANALNQASKELVQRFDFRGTDASVEQTPEALILRANSEERVKAAYGVVQEKLVKRKVSLKYFEASEPAPGPKGASKLTVKVTEGIAHDKAKDVIRRIKDSKLKVQAAIQDQSLRISGKNRDDLQAAIQLLKREDFGLDLQFTNFRD